MLKTLSFYILLIIAFFYSSCKGQTNKLPEKELANMLSLQGKAMDAQMSGDDKTALKYYNLIISRYHNNPDGYYGRAGLKERIKDYEGAVKDVDTALNLLPDKPERYIERGDYLSFRGDCNKLIQKNKEAKKDYNMAVKAYENILEIYAGDGRALERKSWVEERLKDYKAAIADLETAIKYNPQQVYYYQDLAHLKNKIGDYQGAILTSNSTLQIDSNNAFALYDLGYSYFRLKNYESAIGNFNKCLLADPKFSEALYYRGLAKFNLQDKIGACEDWHTAVDSGYTKADSVLKVNCH
jgi:tetratricopeptide (TPR) repeat protein